MKYCLGSYSMYWNIETSLVVLCFIVTMADIDLDTIRYYLWNGETITKKDAYLISKLYKNDICPTIIVCCLGARFELQSWFSKRGHVYIASVLTIHEYDVIMCLWSCCGGCGGGNRTFSNELLSNLYYSCHS